MTQTTRNWWRNEATLQWVHPVWSFGHNFYTFPFCHEDTSFLRWQKLNHELTLYLFNCKQTFWAKQRSFYRPEELSVLSQIFTTFFTELMQISTMIKCSPNILAITRQNQFVNDKKQYFKCDLYLCFLSRYKLWPIKYLYFFFSLEKQS